MSKFNLKSTLLFLLIITISGFIFQGCNKTVKKDEPTVTLTVLMPDGYKAIIYESIYTFEGTTTGISETGICWSKSNQTPTIDDFKTEADFLSSEIFQGTLGDIDFHSTYYFRTYLKIPGDTVHYSDVVVHTTGAGWQNNYPTSYLNMSSSNFYSIHFFDINHGHVYGANGPYYNTLDGGETWNEVAVGHTDPTSNIEFITTSIGYMLSYSSNNAKLRKTIDGGLTWQNLNVNPSTTIKVIHPVTEDVIFILTESDTVKRSIDGGATWTAVRIYNLGLDVNDISFITVDIGYAITSGGSVYKTIDSGTNWVQTNSSGVGSPIRSLEFLTESEGIATGGNGIYRTTDGGVTWDKELEDEFNSFFYTDFIDANNGVCGGLKGKIWRTRDGGETWTLDFQSESEYDYILDMQLLSAEKGFALLDYKTLLKYY